MEPQTDEQNDVQKLELPVWIHDLLDGEDLVIFLSQSPMDEGTKAVRVPSLQGTNDEGKAINKIVELMAANSPETTRAYRVTAVERVPPEELKGGL